jgi:hypothetical protein
VRKAANKQKPENVSAKIAEEEEWIPAKEIAPRIRKSTSYVYSLVRRGSGIPYAQPSPGTLLFNWKSVNAWLHGLEKAKRRANFEE